MSQVIRPYGDTTGDGMVQVSFTLPVPHDKRAEGAALQLAGKMGLSPALLVHAKAVGPAHTFFVVYGSVTHLVELDKVQVQERDFPLLAAKEVNGAIKKALRRPLVVVEQLGLEVVETVRTTLGVMERVHARRPSSG